MSKLSRILVIIILLSIATVIFVQTSSVPNYPIYLGILIVLVLGLFIWLQILLTLPRLKLTFGGGVGRPGRKEVGDHQIHWGGAIFGVIVMINNIGGEPLTLETYMALRDKKSGQRLYKVPLMPNPPLPEQQSAESSTVQLLGLPKYCPKLIELDRGKTEEYRLYFFVDALIVDKIGIDEHGTVRAWNAERDIIFVDRGLGYVFTFKNGKANEYECKRSRLH